MRISYPVSSALSYYVCITLLFICFFISASSAAALAVNDSASGTASPDTEVVMEFNDDEANLVLFVGRFHPLLVHLPIGFLLFALLLEFAALFKRFEQLAHAVPFALLLGVLSGIAAGVTGYMLSTAGGYGEELLSYHKWLGIAVSVLALVAFLLRVNFYTTPLLKRLYAVVMLLMAGTLMATGHYGGSLTHGSDYLFRYMPEPMRAVLGYEPKEEEGIALIKDLDSALVYDHVIQPILGLRCQSCHNADRTEGELMLTSFQRLMEGGESGPSVIPHHIDQSELYQRLLLPASDELRMPPSGRRQLTTDQIKLIAWWIEQGAPSSSKVTELEISDEISQILFKLTEESQSFLARTQVPPADPQILAQLNTDGFAVAPVAEGVNFLQVRFTKSADSIDSGDLEKLLPVSEQITWINLARSGVLDDDLSSLAEFRNLTRLNLQLTEITDSALKYIGSLNNLEYLNLYGTAVTDDGLQHLQKLSNLTALYLWQTEVSREAIQHLKDQLPKLYVDSGWVEDEAAVIGTEETSASIISEQ